MKVVRYTTLSGRIIERFIPETREEEAELRRELEAREVENPTEPATFEDFLHPG